MKRFQHLALAALVGGGMVTTAHAVVLSDSFNRTDTTLGSNDNALGGSIVQTYLSLASPPAVTNGSQAQFEGGLRSIVDTNLRTGPSIVSAGGFILEASINPTDDGGGGAHGRGWAGFIVASPNAPAAGANSAAMDQNANTQTRLGIGVRNSGSMLRRINNSTDYTNASNTDDANDLFFGIGNPQNASFNEPIFDPAVQTAYAAASATWSTGFINPKFYGLRIEVTVPSFVEGGTATARVFVDNVQVDMDLTTGGTQDATFRLGSNGDIYAWLVGFGGSATNPHLVDNLRISAIPEPASLGLLALGGLTLVRRRRA